jgi:hypothetical protein
VQKLLLVGIGLCLLLMPQVVSAQDITRWNGILEEVEILGDQFLLLRFEETDITGGAILLIPDDQNVCQTRDTFPRFLQALDRDTDGQVWAATIPECRSEGYFAVCIDVDGRGRTATCTSFFLAGWNFDWVE